VPRQPRHLVAADFFHVFNRANRRRTIFEEPADYEAFLTILAEAPLAPAMRILAYCLMPNHWHLVVWPQDRRALSAYMHWVTSTHVRRWLRHRALDGTGHLYQGRFKSVPIAGEYSLLAVLRYVEANAKRAGLVDDAAAWRWSSLRSELGGIGPRLWPIPRPADWMALVNDQMAPATLERIRGATASSRPLHAPARRGRPPRRQEPDDHDHLLF
jgi:putative transposase